MGLSLLFYKGLEKNGVHASLPLANKLRVLNLNLNKNATEKFENRWQNFCVEASPHCLIKFVENWVVALYVRGI